MKIAADGAIVYLSAILSGLIASGQGFEEAEALYAESFRCAGSFSVKEKPELFEEMVGCLTADIYPPEEPFSVFGDNCDEWGENPHEHYDREPLVYGMTREQAVEAVNGGARFFEICNYKGEGEGFLPEQLGKNLRVFVKKWSYI